MSGTDAARRQDRHIDATAWTVIGTGVAILAAIGTAFWSMRGETRVLQARIDAQGQNFKARLDEQGEELRVHLKVRERTFGSAINAQGEQMILLRERMAHLEGLLEGLREAITGTRAA